MKKSGGMLRRIDLPFMPVKAEPAGIFLKIFDLSVCLSWLRLVKEQTGLLIFKLYHMVSDF